MDRVLGDEAALHAEWDDLEGVVVDVEITDWPTPTQNPRGRVYLKFSGRQDDFGVDVEIIIRKFHLPHHFPAATLEEAQDIPAIIPAQELRRRRDFRSVPIVTIDGETARDFDDAVYGPPPRKWEFRIAGSHRRRGAICNARFCARSGSATPRDQRLFS